MQPVLFEGVLGCLEWQTITLSLPADTVMPAPAAQWEQRDGRIVATYTREELTLAVGPALEQKRRDLEARLEWSLEVLAAVGRSVNSGNPALAGQSDVRQRPELDVTCLSARIGSGLPILPREVDSGL